MGGTDCAALAKIAEVVVNSRYHAVVIVGVALLALSVQARTWRVELDGSGDFTDIQPVVDAAASGDTILVGPGRFDTFHPITAPAWTEDAIVGVLKDDLSFIGAGQGVTILGPTSYRGVPGENPKVFCSFGGYSARIEDMTIEQVEAGVFWEQGSLEVTRCSFRATSPGFDAMQLLTDSCTVRDCGFDQPDGGAAIIILNSMGNVRSCHIVGCSIVGASYGIHAGYGAHGVVIEQTMITGPFWGIVYEQGSSGSISNVVVSGTSDRSLLVKNASSVTINDSEFEGGNFGFDVSGGSIVNGTGLIIRETSNAAMRFYLNGQATIHGSHILPASGWAFDCFSYSSTPVSIDLTGNYWGTTDAAAIAASIHDSQDDPALHCTVLYEPFANGPVPAESTSWGDLKALFR